MVTPVSVFSTLELNQLSTDIAWVHAQDHALGKRLRRLLSSYQATHSYSNTTAPFTAGAELYLVKDQRVQCLEYMQQCRAENYHLLKDLSSEEPFRLHTNTLRQAYTSEKDAYEALLLELENQRTLVKSIIQDISK